MDVAADRIEIRGLRVLARHGVLAEERERAQPFEIDLVIEADLTEAAQHDDLARTVDYGEVTERVAALATESSHALIETLAGAIAHLVTRIERVRAVTVTVRKLNPPIAADLRDVGVTLRRERPAG
jgi:dihydroneopterin aldolase